MSGDRLPARWEDQPRNGRGRWQRARSTAERDGLILDMAQRGRSTRSIGRELGMSPQSVSEARRRALRDAGSEHSRDIRDRQALQLEHMYEHLAGIAEADHLAYGRGGNVVWLVDPDTGQKVRPVLDPGPNIAARVAMLRVLDTEARLFGTYAPTRQRVSVITDEDLADLVAAEEAAAEAAENECNRFEDTDRSEHPPWEPDKPPPHPAPPVDIVSDDPGPDEDDPDDGDEPPVIRGGPSGPRRL